MTRHQLIEKLHELRRLREAAGRIEKEIIDELDREATGQPDERGHDSLPVLGINYPW